MKTNWKRKQFVHNRTRGCWG